MQCSGKVIMGSIFLVLGAAMLKASHAENNLLMAEAATRMDAMTYPRMLIYSWIVMSVIYIVTPAQKMDRERLRSCMWDVVKVTLCIALYFLMFSWLGLTVSTFLFLMIFFSIMGYKKIYRALCIASSSSIVAWLTFEKFLGISLPGNVLFEYFMP